MEEDRKKKLALRYIIIGGVGLLVAPIIGAAIYGVAGLIVLGGMSFISIQLWPVVAMKVANWRMRLIEGEAERNPIQTLKNLYLEKNQELEESEKSAADFEAELGSFDDQVEGFKRQYPEEAPSYIAISEKMHEGLAQLESKQELARKALVDLNQKIAKAESIYKMSLAAQKVLQFSKSAEDKVFQDIKAKVAFDSVRTNMHRAFADLNLAVRQSKKLQAGSPSSIPVLMGTQTGRFQTSKPNFVEVER